MRGIVKGSIIFLLFFLFFPPFTFAEESMDKIEDSRAVYTVGVGDVLTVRLREGAKLQEYDTTVMSSGTIMISFIELEAAGYTIDEIREKARSELGKYIRDFSVDLIAREWRERKIFVLGEVKNPGVYNFAAGLTLMQALAMAGGYTDTAVLKDMRIIRGNLDNPKLIRVNMKRTAKGKEMKDIILAQNDVIFIPRSAIGNWNAFVKKIRPTIELLSLPVHGGATVKSLAE
jgi:polysaccharide export outer membrane protein